jgi:hypothetical protein
MYELIPDFITWQSSISPSKADEFAIKKNILSIFSS